MFAEKNCRRIRKLILRMPEGKEEEVLGMISQHLSECEACRRLLAVSRKLDRALIGEKLSLDEIARHSRARKDRVLAEIAPQPKSRAWRFRAACAGAGALLLAIAAGSVLYFLRGENGEPPRPAPFSSPRVTQAMAAAASSEALHELAEAVRRHEAPSFELPYTPPAPARESFVPRLLQQSTLQSEETLGMIVESRTNLTRREET
jgi:anti-sigma factor RsiW